MHDLRMIREQVDTLREGMRRRGKLDTLGPIIDRAQAAEVERRELIQAEEFPATIVANVAGTGSASRKTALFKGTVLLSGRRVEIKQD